MGKALLLLALVTGFALLHQTETAGIGSLFRLGVRGVSSLGRFTSRAFGSLGSGLGRLATRAGSGIARLGSGSLRILRTRPAFVNALRNSPKLKAFAKGANSFLGLANAASLATSVVGIALSVNAQDDAKQLEASIAELAPYYQYAYCQVSYVVIDLQSLEGDETYDQLIEVLEELKNAYNALPGPKAAFTEDECGARCDAVPNDRYIPWKNIGCSPRCNDDQDTINQCSAKMEALFGHISSALEAAEDYQNDLEAEANEIKKRAEDANLVAIIGK